jgi:hypothetical protein
MHAVFAFMHAAAMTAAVTWQEVNILCEGEEKMASEVLMMMRLAEPYHTMQNANAAEEHVICTIQAASYTCTDSFL